MVAKISLLRVQRGIRRRLGAKYAGRKLSVLPDDIFLVSFPKSGNTWTRFLIANLFYPQEEINFSNIEAKIPDIYQNTEKQLLSLNTPRLLKSHEYLDPRYQKVILIVRDPRDVLVSSYFHFLKFRVIDESVTIEEFSKQFMAGEVYFVGAHNPVGSWADNVGSWLGARDSDPQFLLVRYEDMQVNTTVELRRISAFLGLDSSDQIIERSVKQSSSEQMRKLEQQEHNVWPAKQSRKDISFVRSAQSGGWQESLPSDVAARMATKWHSVMTKLKYIS